ncbi:MAG: NYN domain-containing protein [Oscillospiraceae bacterium]
MPKGEELRLAVLIDADNASRTAMKAVMAEIAVYGTPTIKRIYGDWTAPNMGTWKSILLETAISPVQQYGYTTGKNSTDSAMIIDAMDILYSGNCDGFVLVSSDSDFTRLAVRLREAGMKVIGMGERKTPKPFIVACDKFVYIEVIRAAAKEQTEPVPAPAEPEKKPQKKKAAEVPAKEPPAPTAEPEPVIPQDIVNLIGDSIEMIADEDGYAFMGELGNLLNKKRPDFDSRNYGFPKLTGLIESLDRFEVDKRQTSNPHTKHVYLRDKTKK